MTREQLFERVIEHSSIGRPLFSPILMQFAAHHIGRSYKEFYLDHTVLVEANIRCMHDFAASTVSCISDPGREAEGFGGVFEYPQESVPHCISYPVSLEKDPQELKIPDPNVETRMRDRIDAIRLYRERLDGDVPIIGWVEGPLALACDVMDLSSMLMAMLTEEQFTHNLLDKTMVVSEKFAVAQIEAGAHIIGIGDAICSQISPSEYEKWVLPYHRRLTDSIHAHGALVKLHICGDITHLLPSISRVGVDILDLDWQVDMEHAYELLGDSVIRCGNIDPAAVIEQQDPTWIMEAVNQLVSREKGRPFILSAGCEITPLTPKENLKAISEALTANRD